MKNIAILSGTALCVLALNAGCSQTENNNTSGKKSTYQQGQSGYNGSGDGVETHLFNGTGDVVKTSQGSTSYSAELSEKGILPGISAPDTTRAMNHGPQPAHEGTTSESRNGSAGAGAGAEAKH